MKAMKISLNDTIYQLVKKDDKIINILSDIGFSDITKPGMVNTVGRFMSLNKGAKMKNINIDYIKEVLMQRGYEVLEDE